MKRKQHGWIQASPTQYLIHYRRGRVIRQGMGLGAWCLPVFDHCCLVPCTANSLSFAADQITQENQGVEIAGFAVWKIAQPELTAKRFDFDDPQEPTRAIGECLKDVVESAIRHRVANMTIEEVLRKRATIIIELKRELDYITTQWGLEIDTIEIKHVRIMSGEVFAHLQAPYREELRLESESTRLRTENEIAVKQLAQQDELHQQESTFQQRAQVRDSQTRQQKGELEQQEAVLALQRKQQVQQEQYRQDIAGLAAEVPLLFERERVAVIRRGQEACNCEHLAAMADLRARAAKLATTADNERRPDLALINALPEIAGKLKIGEVSVTPEILTTLAQIGSRLRGPAHRRK